MWRFIFLLLLLSGAGHRVLWSASFETGITLVKVDARVYDASTGAPIRGLTAADFKVYDESTPRDIAYFGSESEPLDLVLLLDVSGTMREVLPAVAEQAAGALAHLHTSDRAAVMAFGKRSALLQPLTTEASAVVHAIEQAFIAPVGLDTDISRAVLAAADYLRAEHNDRRRAILVMTDNIQETSTSDRTVEEALYEADAVVDAFVVHGRIALPRFMRAGGVFRFAAKTGGEVIEGEHPAARLGELFEQIRARYSIHFRPVQSASPAPRRIRVELSPDARRRFPKAIVRARRRYFPAPSLPAPNGDLVAYTPEGELSNETLPGSSGVRRRTVRARRDNSACSRTRRT